MPCNCFGFGFSTVKGICFSFPDPPEIVLKPLSQDIVEGNEVSLLCNASGNPQPKITWRRQGNSDVLSSSGTLFLRNLVSEDDGSVYTCRVENYLGSRQASVTITMQCKG